MKTCRNCGAENEESNNFCVRCAAPTTDMARAVSVVPLYKRPWFLTVVILVFVATIYFYNKPLDRVLNLTANAPPVSTTRDTFFNAAKPITVNVGAGDIGDYEITILGYSLTEDYEGNKAIAVTYKWGNYSDQPKSLMFSLSCEAFQDGVECSRAILPKIDGYRADETLNDVMPGYEQTVLIVYVLRNTKAPVDIEITNAFSPNSYPKVTQTFDIG